MVIPKGAVAQETSNDSSKKKKKSKKDSFDELLDELERYEEGCDNRSLMDST